jgi:5-methylcytosine-specific restriction endonuclease McrA
MDTLVLDVSYQPVARVEWETAIVWALEKIVEVVDEYPDKSINTVNWSVKMPSIVRFVKAIHRKKAIKFSRHNVYARDKGRCQYCNCKTQRHYFTYDHVLPRAQGGKTSWENVVVACVPCNQRKGGRTPEQAGMHLRSHPVKPKSLPNTLSSSMMYHPSMPDSWKDWLRSATYWDGSLDTD